MKQLFHLLKPAQRKSDARCFTRLTQISSQLRIKAVACSLLFLLSLFSQPSFAQDARRSDVTGTVVTEKGEILQGATVQATNTSTNQTVSTVTDDNGAFLFRKLVVGNKYNFNFSFLGYEQELVNGFEVKGTEKNSVTVRLKEKNAILGQVVVTALGIVQKKASLGYSTQEIKGSTLNEARDNNFINSISGRVAGVNIISGTTVGASARITIRGESSLNYFKNQPLVVIDGVPIGNDPVTNPGGSTPDYGSSLSELNPADIESVNVLKGAAASALYGSRAASGALVITTKSGAKRKGVGVNFTSGYTWENPLLLPKFQNSFGAGNGGLYEGSNFGNSNNGLYPNGTNEDWDESWGPATNGQLMAQFNSPTTNGFRGADVNLPNRGDIIPTPFVSYPNNMKDYFVTGHTRYNSVALTGGNDQANFRFSYTNNNEAGIVPNNNLTRNVFNLKSSYKLSDRLTADVAGTYTNTKSTSRPNLGYDNGTPMYEFVWFDRSIDMNSLRNYWQPGLEGIQQFSHDYGNSHDNPFFTAYQNTNGQTKDQIYGNVKLNYKILDNLSVMGRVGTDYFNDFRPSQKAFSSLNNPQGAYSETTLRYQENNYDFLINYKKNINDFHFDLSGGGNTMERKRSSRSASTQSLVIPGIYSLNNNGSTVNNSAYDEKRRTNSLYAFLQTDYQGKIYLNVTGRNDWSSTLPASSNSYFYPSVNSSFLLNRIFKMSEKIDLLKFRLAYAQAGNDANPYNILTPYGQQPLYNGIPSVSESGQLNNLNLKPEKSSTSEIGVEIALFKGRLGLDVTAYSTSSKNQILSLPTPTSSGYNSRVINAGEISNKGIEVQLNAVPLKFSNGFTWNLNINFARNVSKVVSLSPGVDRIVQLAPGEDASIQAVVGERTGAL
ncbi:MAG: SusC/RagA family TonB-linked outer membrane protein, partial [Chitinophagaceae bacterium]|nr:SusC/RagA family TonB-linked outer membrane protein [Chitinophagaceae bacterium]